MLSRKKHRTVAWAKLYHRSLWEENRFPVGRKHEDEAVMHRLMFQAGKIVCSADEIYFYRTRPGSIMADPDRIRNADIFKAQFYKFYVAKNQKDEFIEKWKNLEILCKEVFSKKDNTSTDEIFNRYMYYQRALKGNKNSTTEGLRDFYEKDSYALLKSDRTFEDLQNLGSFWQAISIQDKNYFDENTLRWLFILNYAPNIMWANITSVYLCAFG